MGIADRLRGPLGSLYTSLHNDVQGAERKSKFEETEEYLKQIETKVKEETCEFNLKNNGSQKTYKPGSR